ncbi:MAG TPA: ABC transporter permease [Pseudolabrys sp.]|nr:ABC transporter permease [Pseudolabrys sp.]
MDDLSSSEAKTVFTAAQASGHSFHRIGAPRLWTIDLVEVWDYRALILLLAWRSIRVRYKQTILGLLWALIAPVAFTAMFVLFFSLLPVRPSGDLPYVPVAFAGMILWQFFSRGVTEAGVSLTANANLITKIYFPRVILPLAAAVSSLTELLVTFVMLLVLLLFYDVPIGPMILVVPALIMHVFILVVGFGLWLAAIDGLFRDLRHAMPLLLQLGMFISPVAYTTSALVPTEWHWLYNINPMVVPLEGFRWATIAGASAPAGGDIAISLLVTVVIFCSGAMFFARVERKVVDLV